jgi:hypothetical protein
VTCLLPAPHRCFPNITQSNPTGLTQPPPPNFAAGRRHRIRPGGVEAAGVPTRRNRRRRLRAHGGRGERHHRARGAARRGLRPRGRPAAAVKGARCVRGGGIRGGGSHARGGRGGAGVGRGRTRLGRRHGPGSSRGGGRGGRADCRGAGLGGGRRGRGHQGCGSVGLCEGLRVVGISAACVSRHPSPQQCDGILLHRPTISTPRSRLNHSPPNSFCQAACQRPVRRRRRGLRRRHGRARPSAAAAPARARL